MFGKWVVVNLGDGVKCEVFVLCVPSTPDDVLQTRAFSQLASRLTQRAVDVWRAGVLESEGNAATRN